MQLIFESIDEVRDFVTKLKGTRGGKNSGSDEADTNTAGTATGQAPAPLQPPQGGPSFAPPGNAAPAFTAPSFPGGSPLPTAAPEVAALVGRISARMDAIIASGQTKADDMLGWFRAQCVQNGFPEAGGATLDQIKGSWLAKLPQPSLDVIAKTIAA